MYETRTQKLLSQDCFDSCQIFWDASSLRKGLSTQRHQSQKHLSIPVLFHCLTDGLAGELINWEHNLTTESKLFFNYFIYFKCILWQFYTFWSQYHIEKHKIKANVTQFCKKDVPEPKPGTHGQGGHYLWFLHLMVAVSHLVVERSTSRTNMIG